MSILESIRSRRTERPPHAGARRSGASDFPRRARVRWAACAAAALVTAPALAVLNTQSAAAWTPYCGESEFIHEIRVQDWDNGEQKISITPRGDSRLAVDASAATIGMWHAVQNCVSGLYGPRADSVYDQLECHQHLAAAWFATGETYGLETWRPTFEPAAWFVSHCGNKLGPDPAGPFGGYYRPDAGATDLQGTFDSIA